MTPEEIDRYKNEWIANDPYSVKLTADKDVQGKQWCRQHLGRQNWSMSAFTDTKEHTFLFEREQDAREFEQTLK